MANRTKEQTDLYLMALRGKMREYMKRNDKRRVQDIKQVIAKTIGTVIITF
jgi:hypothetical protein